VVFSAKLAPVLIFWQFHWFEPPMIKFHENIQNFYILIGTNLPPPNSAVRLLKKPSPNDSVICSRS